MPWRSRSTPLSRLLFCLVLLLAAALLGAVLLAPLLPTEGVEADGWGVLVELFAQDATLRRTGIASAIGLFVTAWVFFRPMRFRRPLFRRRPRQPRPPRVVGA
jgi:hypothetical protein